MPQVQITQAALPISNPGGQTLYGQNNGNGVLYLSTTQDVNPSNYHAIVGPGGSFSWPADEALYACTDVGGTTLLTYLTNGATVDSGNVTNNPANKPTLLTLLEIDWAAGAGSYTPASTPNIDVTSFASLLFILATSGTDNAPLASNYVDLAIEFLDFSVPIQLSSKRAQWLLTDCGLYGGGTALQVNTFKVPVEGPTFIFSIMAVVKLLTAFSGKTVIGVYGSGQVLDTHHYVSGGKGLATELATNGQYHKQIVGNGTVTEFVASKSGLAKFLLTGTAAGAAGFFPSFADGGAIAPMGEILSVAANNATVVELSLPTLPLQVQTLSTGGGTATAAILQ
jgi:hypothetical protein